MNELAKTAEVVDIGTRYQMYAEGYDLLRRRVLLEKNALISDEAYQSEQLLITAHEMQWAKRWGIK